MPSPALAPQNAHPSINNREAPSLASVLAIILGSYVVFLVFLTLAGGSYWSLVGGKFGDNPAYLEAVSAIRHWDFSGVVVKQFWGLPYMVAALSLLTGLPATIALVAVCVASSLLSVALCYRIWDGWIAAFFALLSFDWFQRSLLGGAEPLFVALLLGSFLSLRRGNWWLAAVLGALSTVVRPFGVFALIGLGIQLLYRKKVGDCAIATAIALGIGTLYAWPFHHYFGNPFANVALYQRSDWHGGLPFDFPFVAIIRDTIPVNAPLTNLALTWGWILFVLAGLIVAIRSGVLQHYARTCTAEACFVFLYCLALYMYDAPGWSRSNFPRFALPMLPWTLFFLRPYLPKNLKVVWGLAVITPVLAAASSVGIRNAAAILLKRFH